MFDAELSLSELFALADEIGNKYLTDEELEEQQIALFEAYEIVNETIADLGLDD